VFVTGWFARSRALPKKRKNPCTANALSYMSLVISSKPDAQPRRATMLTWNAALCRANYSLTQFYYNKQKRECNG
jgi:hypothetical protein